MANLYLVPEWFFGFDIIFELAFAIITLAVAISAKKAYNLSGQNQHRLFSISFFLFSLSYFMQSAINFSILYELEENIMTMIHYQNILALNLFGLYIHMILFTIGLSTLAYLTLKIDNKRAYYMILSLSLVSFLFSLNNGYLFYVLSSLLLIFIAVYYTTNFLKHKQKKTLLVSIAFILLLSSHIHFIFSVNHALFYAIGHFFELAAYVLILINLLILLKK